MNVLTDKELGFKLRDLSHATQCFQFPNPLAYESVLSLTSENVMSVLNQSLTNCQGSLIRRCLDFISTHTISVLRSSTFLQSTLEAIIAFLEIDCLESDEDEVWTTVLQWVVAQKGLPTDHVRSWTPEEVDEARSLLTMLLQEGKMRALSIDSKLFCIDIEGCKMLEEEELIWKYRWDALIKNMGHCERLWKLFYPPSAAFKTHKEGCYEDDVGEQERRIIADSIRMGYTREKARRYLRRKVEFVESAHPHPKSASSVVSVRFPQWVRCITALFDDRSEITADASLMVEYCSDDGAVCVTEEFGEENNSCKINGACPRQRAEGNLVRVKFRSGLHTPTWGYQIRFEASFDVR